MKKNLVLIALVLLLGVSVGAQGYVYVPDSNPAAGSNNGWPFNMSMSTARYIEILDAKNLTGAPVKFTEVALSLHSQYSPTSLFQAQQFQMRMSHTTAPSNATPAPNTFASKMEPCPINLINTSTGFTYQGTGETWVDFGTAADFGYDGKRNICLEFRYRGWVKGTGIVFWSDPVGTARMLSRSTTIDNYSATTSTNYLSTQGLKVRLTYVKNDILLVLPDSAPLGSTTPISYINGTAGHTYQLAASLGQSPLPLGSCKIFLTPDNVFLTSVLNATPVFAGYSGTLSASGAANGMFVIPKIKQLVGLCVYHAGITYLRGTITGCTNTDGVQIIP